MTNTKPEKSERALKVRAIIACRCGVPTSDLANESNLPIWPSDKRIIADFVGNATDTDLGDEVLRCQTIADIIELVESKVGESL